MTQVDVVYKYGAIPTEAVLTPTELRAALKLVNLKIVILLIKMLFAR